MDGKEEERMEERQEQDEQPSDERHDMQEDDIFLCEFLGRASVGTGAGRYRGEPCL
ncbi:MAG: hypothetical protein V1728_05525 [Candidatus Micrarchaeota archaeon]